MSINVSSLLLRTCKVGTLTVEVDFERMTPKKRNAVIRQLEGKSHLSPEPVASIRAMYKVPFVANEGWRNIPKDSEFWTRLDEAHQLKKVIGCVNPDYADYVQRDVEAALKSKPPQGWIWTRHGEQSIFKLLPLSSYVEPVPLDNPVHELIAKLKAGENPPLRIQLDAGRETEYEAYRR